MVPPPLPASAIPEPPPTPPPSAAPPSDEGTLTFAAGSAGHRVFVDGKFAGDAPNDIKVHCGSHVVKVGSGGNPHTLDVPCGGQIEVPAH
jgi:hypothetical protein